MEQEIKHGLAVLSPANFGMIMATGVVSLAAYYLNIQTVSYTLFYLNNLQYLVLCILLALRAVYYPRRFFSDMFSHSGGSAYFTLVAGTNILGAQHIIMMGNYGIGLVLWGLGLFLWATITYTVFAALVIKEEKPTLDKGISGAWLLSVVATQSIAVLSSLLADNINPLFKLEFNFIALSMWLWGGMLYIWLISLIFYRYTFYKMAPSDLAPPYWINMGAMAISTLAGALLIENAGNAPYLKSLLPFIKGFTVFFWATATWWVPMLVVLALWRHVYKRFPLRYDPLYWGAVFPLGMYTAATLRMADAMELTFLTVIPCIFFFVALPAWLLTFLGLLGQIRRNVQTSI